MRYWTFKDYLDVHGENDILAWFHDQPKNARARINLVIQRLEVMEQLPVKLFKPIPGAGRGLWEIRVRVESVQYRPLCFRGPGRKEITILVGAREKGNKFDPLSAPSTAQIRMSEVSNGRSICDHDFS